MSYILVQGMLGLGDNIHQRAVIRQLIQQHHVSLETPYPCIYHDLLGPQLDLVNRRTNLRTQTKNAAREADKFRRRPAHWVKKHRIWYTHDQIKQKGGFLAAMCHNSNLPVGDFSLPVPDAWKQKAIDLIGHQTKPIMVYRPLVARREWDGCHQRNPDAQAYVTLARSIRDRYCMVSVADLEEGKEWTVSDPMGADYEFHAGEMDVEAIAGLMSLSSLVFCSPGFALVMAQAVGARLVAVFGGHESGRLYDHGDPDHLFIEPIHPCECFSKSHPCDKSIDLDAAVVRLAEFG